MTRCDLCGITNRKLATLDLKYQHDGVIEVCDDCESMINNRLRKLRDHIDYETQNLKVDLVRRIIERFKQGKKTLVKP